MIDLYRDTTKMAISELKRYKLRMQILLYLYKKSPLSALSLSKKIHVSLPTVRSILEELIEEKIVQIAGVGNSQGGRPPMLYSQTSDAYYIIAIELGHHTGKAQLFNNLNQEISSVQEFTTNINDPKLVEHVDKILKKLLKETKLEKNKIAAIGMSMPGLIDANNGLNRTIKNPEYRNVKQRFSARFNIPVYIENDARMQALGEFVFGKAKNTQNTIVLNWNWGLGVGMILNGQIYQGSNGSAGELSHIRILQEGKLCECGKQGCLETIASATVLIEMAQEAIKEGAISQLTTQFSEDPEQVSVSDIIQCAKKGDELSISLLNKLGTKLAWGLSILIQLVNPELIVLNGPLIEARKFILIPIQQTLNQYCLENIINNVKIEISDMGAHSGLKGVAVMVFQKIFRDKSIEPASGS